MKNNRLITRATTFMTMTDYGLRCIFNVSSDVRGCGEIIDCVVRKYLQFHPTSEKGRKRLISNVIINQKNNKIRMPVVKFNFKYPVTIDLGPPPNPIVILKILTEEKA